MKRQFQTITSNQAPGQIFFVRENRETHVGQMNPNLVGPPCSRKQSHQGGPDKILLHLPSRFRYLATVLYRPLLSIETAPSQRQTDRPRLRRQVSVNQSQVFFLGEPIMKLP